jgi:hypothetical protein
MELIEMWARSMDQLDEQLHAGYFLFFLSSKNNFISNSIFIYPVVLVLVGFLLPHLFDLLEENENEAFKDQEKEEML